LAELAVTVPVMLRGPCPSQCRFVAVASAAGERGLFKLAGYVASKHAVIGIVRGLAADLVGTGLAVMAVSPGSTDTPCWRRPLTFMTQLRKVLLNTRAFDA
jgi:NAD(P)-dependent dehydrogenase (short-subunit alcohol dehydrogenase family)